MGVLCGNPSSKISACFEILFKILRELFFVLSPATVYVISAGLFSFLQLSKARAYFRFHLIYDPSFCLIISLSLRLSPHEFIMITSDDFNLGANLIAAKACEGSSEGEMFSSFETN